MTQQDVVHNYQNIRKKPKLFDLLRHEGYGISTALYPNVYLSAAVYEGLHTDNPDPYHVSVLIHEEEHIQRIKRYGIFRWYARYLWSRRFRVEEELAAYRSQFTYLKAKDLTFNFARVARGLSSWQYLWAVSYTEALERLQKLWDEA